jgi:ABC-2 type transport system ATP-binding protein
MMSMFDRGRRLGLLIQTMGLTKRYGRARGIENLSIHVSRGDIYGFIGSNGAGKSTTIRLLLGLIRPSGGSAKVLGLDILKHKKEILAGVGYVPSEISYYSGMRGMDAARMAARLRRVECTAEARRLAERLSLDLNRKVTDLSFGNKKKVAIVCALQHKPDLLILDEPTSGLDPLMQKAFWDIILERHRQGATVFLSSHVLSEIQQHCTRAAIIREGRLVVEDDVRTLAQTAAKRVTLHNVRGELPEIQGAKDMHWVGSTVSFLVQGDARQLLEDLRRGDFEDLTITEPDMEEIFLHFYENEGVRA